MKSTVGLKIGTGFGTALLFLAGIGSVSYRSTNKLTETADWVTHTHKVLEALDGILQGFLNAETGQRGFVITGQEQYLEPYRIGTAQANRCLNDARNLTADNQNQQRRLDALENLTNQHLAQIQQGVDLRRAKGAEAAREWVLNSRDKQQIDEIRRAVAEMRDEELGLLKSRSDDARSVADSTRLTILLGSAIAFGVLLFVSLWITRSISGRLRPLTVLARKVAGGDLTGLEIDIRSGDELGDLGTAFNAMRIGLRELATQIRTATENVNSTAAEILASTQQQASATKEQAASIQEITSTVEEINQSGSQIGERASQVSGAIETSSTATQRGMNATQETSQTMESIRDQVEEVAQNVVGLSERTQTIGEIIATVSEIAEQSNLLALNASIEAVSAGEQGGRFSVVAHEMKNLADRAKDCTIQVRTILGEIQKGINTSVMLTEEAVKRAESGKLQSHATEATIRQVAETNQDSIQAYQQIVAGANQQQIGVRQVTQGMQDIRQAVQQTAAGTLQLEKAAANMNALSQQLRRLVDQYRV